LRREREREREREESAKEHVGEKITWKKDKKIEESTLSKK